MSKDNSPKYDTEKFSSLEEAVRHRYVYGSEISQRAIAKLFDISSNRVANWSRHATYEGKPCPWPIQRQQIQSELQAKTDQKLVDTISTQTADIRAEATLKHNQALTDLIDLAIQWPKLLKQMLDAEVKGKEPDEKTAKAYNYLLNVGGKSPHTSWSSSLVSAINLQREVLNLKAVVDVGELEKIALQSGFLLMPVEEVYADQNGHVEPHAADELTATQNEP